MRFWTMLARLRPTPSMRDRPGGWHVEPLEDRQYFSSSVFNPTPLTPPPPFTFMVAAGGSLYFQDDISPDRRAWSEHFYVEGGRDSGLWRSDGTSAGTTLVSQNWLESRGGPPAVLDDGRALFSNGYGVSVLDGAGGGAITPITPFQPPVFGEIGPVVSLGGFALFAVGKSASYGFLEPSPGSSTLWRTDGTDAGTTLVLDTGAAEVTEMVAAGGVAHLIVKVPREGAPGEWDWAIWRSDGTAAGTVPVLDLAGRPAFGLVLAGNNEVSFFRVIPGSSSQAERWLSDGTAGGSRVAETYQHGDAWSESEYSRHQLAYGKAVFSTRTDASTGTELMIDGEIVDLAPGAAGSDPQDFFTSADGTLYFSADDGVHGRELWTSDGTAAGTRMVADLAPGEADAAPLSYAEYDGALYVAVAPRHLYRVTGGGAGVERVAYTDAWFRVEARPNQAMVAGATFDVFTRYSMQRDFTPAADRFYVDPSEFERDPGAVRVIGPDGAERAVRFVRMLPERTVFPGSATLAFADGRPVRPSDNGTYTVELLGGRLRNAAGEPTTAAVIGTFELKAPAEGPDVVASIAYLGKPLTSAVGGQKVRVSVTVENRGNVVIGGDDKVKVRTPGNPIDSSDEIHVELRAVPGEDPAANGWDAGRVRVRVKSLAPGQSKTIKAVATLPSYGPDGTRVLRAIVNSGSGSAEIDRSNNAADGPAFAFTRWTRPMRVDVGPVLGTLALNETHTVPVRIENVSVRTFKGTVRLALVESNTSNDPTDFYPAQPLVRRVDLRPGKSVTIHYPFYQTERLFLARPRALQFQVDSLQPSGAGGVTTAVVVLV